MEKTNKEKLIEAVKNIPSIAKEEKWVLTFDRDEGALYYSPKIIPNNAELFQITDEYAIYFNKKYVPRGVMVEYYNQNFIKHHPEFETMTKAILGSDGQEKKMINSNKRSSQQTLIFKALFERTLVAEAFSNNLHKNLRRKAKA
ncbi:MAG: hypothetical protein AAB562_02220 [Patescibacteria group bacterium]